MKEYLVEISLDAQQEIDKAITSLLKYGLKLDVNFVPKRLNIPSDNNTSVKSNYLIKGYLHSRNTQSLLNNCTVTNVWKNSGYIPF